MGPTIATWFVGDSADEATFFPQVGTRSDNADAQAVYWRCTVCFFASSLALNRTARHVLYTNGPVPEVDGIDLGPLLARWGVEVRTVPITFRLPPGAVQSWGNQFYVFDVIAAHLTEVEHGPLVLLDSDCLWLRPADALLAAAERHGALSYWFNSGEYGPNATINGQSRQGLGRFARQACGTSFDAVEYSGGEIIAASAPMLRTIDARVRELWPAVLAQGSDAPREEAHLLSVIYALEEVELGTANRFIRRMWTTFRHSNLQPGDATLSIWHLPAEKRTGFADLFRQLTRHTNLLPGDPQLAPILCSANYARLMGYPHRNPHKFVRDIALKVVEKLG